MKARNLAPRITELLRDPARRPSCTYGWHRTMGEHLLKRMIASGHLGRKTGRGFYEYAPTPETSAVQKEPSPV